MLRRTFLAAVGLSAVRPVLAQSEEEVLASFGRSRKFGVVVRPLGALGSDGGAYVNMAEAQGARKGLGRSLLKDLGTTVDAFPQILKSSMLETLAKLRLPASDVPFLADAGFLRQPYGREEPFYLDCEPTLHIIKLQDKTATHGASISARLMAAHGAHAYTTMVAYGATVVRPIKQVSLRSPLVRFPSFEFPKLDPAMAASYFLSLAYPLGEGFAEIFFKDTIG